MDSSALVGLVGALLGSLLGAVGSYWATVGGARAQSRARLRGAYASLRGRLNDEQSELPQDIQRLDDLSALLTRLMAALGAAGRGEAYQLGTVPVLPDAPDGLRLVLAAGGSLGLPGVLPSAWLAALTPDVGQMPPALYNAIAAYEGVQAYLTTQIHDALPSLIALGDTLSTDQPLRALAQAGTLAAQARRLRLHVSTLQDLYRSLAEAGQAVRAALPPNP